MKQLISINTNIYYSKNGDKYEKHFELVALIDAAKYTRTNGGQIVRERQIEESRFTVTEEGFDKLIAHLTTLRNAKEENLS